MYMYIKIACKLYIFIIHFNRDVVGFINYLDSRVHHKNVMSESIIFNIASHMLALPLHLKARDNRLFVKNVTLNLLSFLSQLCIHSLNIITQLSMLLYANQFISEIRDTM